MLNAIFESDFCTARHHYLIAYRTTITFTICWLIWIILALPYYFGNKMETVPIFVIIIR
jgi:hypothetical protein